MTQAPRAPVRIAQRPYLRMAVADLHPPRWLRLVCFLPVVFLLRDAPAFRVLRFFDVGTFRLRHHAVSHGFVFHFLNAGLAFIEACCFFLSERAGIHALLDAIGLYG